MKPSGTASGGAINGRLRAGSVKSRAIKATGLWLLCSSKGIWRWACSFLTPASWDAACTNSGLKNTVSLALKLPALRTYRSAGSTRSSHWVTDSRKLATITVSATARLSEATTPLTATAAVSRWRLARSTANRGSVWCATRGASWPSNRPINQGSAVMPPTNSRPTDT